jgi:ABC-2 type transport system permease protein
VNTFAEEAGEWVRLRTVRSTWLITALCLAGSGGLGLAVAVHDRHAVSLQVAEGVVNPGQPAPTAVLLGLLGVLAWGHDYRYRTILPLLGVQPRRMRLARARFLVVTGYAALVAVLSIGLGWLAGVLATGGQLSAYLGRAPIPRMVIGSVLLGVGCCWFGMALGALLRSLPAAVAVFLALPVVVEPLVGVGLANLRAGADGWLPFHAVGQVTSRSLLPGGPSTVVGGGLFMAVMLALVLLAGAVFVVRDA